MNRSCFFCGRSYLRTLLVLDKRTRLYRCRDLRSCAARLMLRETHA